MVVARLSAVIKWFTSGRYPNSDLLNTLPFLDFVFRLLWGVLRTLSLEACTRQSTTKSGCLIKDRWTLFNTAGKLFNQKIAYARPTHRLRRTIAEWHSHYHEAVMAYHTGLLAQIGVSRDCQTVEGRKESISNGLSLLLGSIAD